MSAKFRTLDDVDVKGKRVLLRVDLNVPMENGRVTDATRLEQATALLSARGFRVLPARDPEQAEDALRSSRARHVSPPVLARGQGR